MPSNNTQYQLQSTGPSQVTFGKDKYFENSQANANARKQTDEDLRQQKFSNPNTMGYANNTHQNNFRITDDQTSTSMVPHQTN